MTFEQTKTVLADLGFTVVEGTMVIELGEHKICEPLLGIIVSEEHSKHCFDPECQSGQSNNIHIVGTRTALAAMEHETAHYYLRILKENP